MARRTLCNASVVLGGAVGSVLPDPEPEPIGLVIGVPTGLAFGVRGAATTTNGSPPGCGPTICVWPAVVGCARACVAPGAAACPGPAAAAEGTAEVHGVGGGDIDVGTADGEADAGMSGECSSVGERDGDVSLAVPVTVAVPVLVLPLTTTLCSVMGSSPPPPPLPVPPPPPPPAAAAVPPEGALPPLEDEAAVGWSPAAEADALPGAFGDVGGEPPVPICRRLAGAGGRGPMSESRASDEHIEESPAEPSLCTRLAKHLRVRHNELYTLVH